MEEENLQEETVLDTKHEPHEHAHKRLLLGILVFLLLVTFFFYIWPHWGEKIKETCLGDGEVCAVSLSNATISGTEE